jgi:glycosyltransferase involved in cell wall biosynthesis
VIRRLSVIIPTRNRARSLKALLDSLQRSVRPESTAVEMIVVNNGSTDETSDLLSRETHRAQFPDLIVLHQPIPGKANAINLALTVARGDVLLVLDDDVSVHPQCLVKHIEAHEQKILPRFKEESSRGKISMARAQRYGDCKNTIFRWSITAMRSFRSAA